MTRRDAAFSLLRPAGKPLDPPPDRGTLWYDHQIADRFLGGLPNVANKVRWVREHLPAASRLKIGRASAWYEADIAAWLESQRGDYRISA